MKKKVIGVYALVLILVFALSTLAFADDEEFAASPCDYKKYGLDAEKFFIYLTKDTPYTSWQLWPDKGKLQPGKEPHGSFLSTYVNPVAYESITQKKDMAFGSLIVVENYGPDKKLIDLSVKIKIKGFNPVAGDWHWFHYAPDGKVMETGKIGACIECHGKMKENDYIMTAPVK
ncbi:MAG: cytochrome P460 family protein [bacterium]